ncbi:MAG: hypothetical protein J3K34DRAFT_121646 [Monoraphidium minutum]|nr:MAG: hypothetical protein J3K34DRAFT_121646 [Monoraphidium minutum]
MVQPGSPMRDDWVVERPVDGEMSDPAKQLSVQIHAGKMLITINGNTETLDIPEDAFTTHAAAAYARHKLTVTTPRRGPNGPAMVLFGQRERELERQFGADAPGGPEGEEGGAARPQSVKIDYADEKVGMQSRAPRAADAYPVSDSRRVEPVSSMKQAGDICDVCECNPCQCDKLRSSYRIPTELTPAETKRSGKPHMAHTAKPVTGVNSHDAHDYRMHAKPRPEDHSGIGGRTADYQGDVPETGRGSW